MKIESSRQFSEKKIRQISNFMKICPVGVELFHMDRPTDGLTGQ